MQRGTELAPRRLDFCAGCKTEGYLVGGLCDHCRANFPAVTVFDAPDPYTPPRVCQWCDTAPALYGCSCGARAGRGTG